jgi:hypothetical protein
LGGFDLSPHQGLDSGGGRGFQEIHQAVDTV